MANCAGRSCARRLQLAAALAVVGCTSTNSFDGMMRDDSRAPVLDGATSDLGVDDASSGTEAGNCTPQDERCDGRDNDCDGVVDNGFDLLSDPAHCGSCDTVCDDDHARSQCRSGRCELQCHAGYADCDGDPSNGCEAALDSAEHCGSCGNQCEAASPYCLAGESGAFSCGDGCSDGRMGGDERDVDCGGEVRGSVRLRQRDGQHELVGWACDSAVSRSISVHIYLGGPAGRGRLLRAAVANVRNEAAVNTACETSGSRHRFVVPLTAAQLQVHAGRSIYAYGISTRGGPNLALTNSGRDRIPSGDTGGLRLSELARAGQDLTIAPGQEVLIDDNVSLRLLRVQGTLRCRRDVGDYRLQAAGILVSGRLLCGSPNAPFAGKLDIAVDGGVPLMSMGPRTIAVSQGGLLRLHGDALRSGWVKLAESAAAGQRRLVVDRNVRFVRGDLLAIGPTGFAPYEAEQVAVDRVEDGRIIHLRRALRYPHHGRTQQIRVGSRTRTLDQRAEVADLTRNIRIFPSGTPASHNRLGAHLMVMRGGRAYVDAVEFSRMGRMGQMGRYPFHWHRAGSVRGQFIINSSIHHSYQRCVTIHGSNEALVRNNVCFDHFGHGYFLEDGNEVRNRIVNNLGMLSRRPPEARALLISDVKGNPIRFSAPGTFWIAHPDNYVVGNVASGSVGSGFWMSFQRALRCDASGCVVDAQNPNVRPSSAPTWAFSGNTAHTCNVGYTWDGAADGALRDNPRNPNDRELVMSHYMPPAVPTFSRLVGFKNIHTGVYFRGRTVRFDDNLYADNGWSLFFTFNQVVANSTIVGTSAAFSPRDRDYLHRRGKRSGQRGIVLYDGPFDLRDVDFVDYPTQRVMYEGNDVTAVPFVLIGGANKMTNVVSSLRFSPEPFRRVNVRVPLTPVHSRHMNSLRDLDGSLTGQANALVVPDHPLNNHRGCQRRADWGGLVCRHRVGLLFFNDNIAFRILRSDGAQSVARPADAVGHQHNKFNMVLDGGYSYRVQIAAAYRRSPNLRIRFQAELVGATSPVVQIEGMGRNCRLVGATAVSSLAQLRRQARSAYLRAGNTFYIRMVTERAQTTSELARSAVSDTIPLRCDE